MGKFGGAIDSALFAFPEEPFWLAEWVLGDVARRHPAKRQREPLQGMWISRQGKNLRLRRSDQIERNYVATVALASGGLSVKEAISEIGCHLGKTTARELDVLKTGVYRLRAAFKNQLPMMWLGSFRSWMDWAASTSADNLDFVARQFRSKGRPRQARQFLKLVGKIRAKAMELGRMSLYRKPIWYEQAERECGQRAAAAERELGDGPDQHFIGMAFINLARLYNEQGKFTDAIPTYGKAALRWQGAHITEDLRQLMVGWIGSEIEGCRNGRPPGAVPVYSGRWIPK